MEDPIHLVVRCKFELRNPQFGEDVVLKHSEVLNEKGSVWWGIGTAPALDMTTRIEKQIHDGIPSFMFIYETGTPPELSRMGRRWYRTEIFAIQSESPKDPEFPPPHYQGDDKSHAFIRLKSIHPLPYAKDASPILKGRSSFRYVRLQGPSRPKYLHQYSDPRKLVVDLPVDFQGPTVRELLNVDLESSRNSDFLEDLSEEVLISRVPEIIKRVVHRYRRDQRVIDVLKTLYAGQCQFKGYPNRIETEMGWYTEVHHLIPLEKGGSDHPTNLVNLCPQHHKMLHHAKKREELSNLKNFRYKEEHKQLFQDVKK